MRQQELHTGGVSPLGGQVQGRPPPSIPHVQTHQRLCQHTQRVTVTVVGLRREAQSAAGSTHTPCSCSQAGSVVSETNLSQIGR